MAAGAAKGFDHLGPRVTLPSAEIDLQQLIAAAQQGLQGG
jgi:hypothetical protein